MATFIGTIECKVDTKGRVMLPSAFKKQLPASAQEKFVVKKDIFEKCLVLFPLDEWERQTTILRNKLNPYNKEHAQFLRGFYKDTAELELDANNRFLIPKRLLEMAGIESDIYMAGQDKKIEIWAKDNYENIEQTETDMATLAQTVLGNLNLEF